MNDRCCGQLDPFSPQNEPMSTVPRKAQQNSLAWKLASTLRLTLLCQHDCGIVLERTTMTFSSALWPALWPVDLIGVGTFLLFPANKASCSWLAVAHSVSTSLLPSDSTPLQGPMEAVGTIVKRLF